MKRGFALGILVLLMLPVRGTTLPAESQQKVYQAMMRMQVASYRIARDKLYEIFHSDLELIQPDLAESIAIFEKNILFIQSQLKDPAYQAELDRLTDVWNNMRMHLLDVLTPKSYARFYYDSMTMDNLLGVMLNKFEDIYHFNDTKHMELKKQYELRKAFFLTNIGFLTRRYRMARSLHSLFEQNKARVERLLRYGVKHGYGRRTETAPLMMRLLNDWAFFKYNTLNVLFPAERTLFSIVNSLDYHTERLSNTWK